MRYLQSIPYAIPRSFLRQFHKIGSSRPTAKRTRGSRLCAFFVLLACGTDSVAADEPNTWILAGPRALEIDLNGDGVDDFVFANYTQSAHGYFSYSINVRDETDHGLFHSVHVYNDGYGPQPGSRLVDLQRSPECVTRAHFLIRADGAAKYELLTAHKTENRFPPGAGRVEFTFHRLRTLDTVAPAYYVFDGYRSITSDREYCDVVEAARIELGLSDPATPGVIRHAKTPRPDDPATPPEQEGLPPADWRRPMPSPLGSRPTAGPSPTK